jgi:tetratricopeptide (TPR) repeat protein
MSPAFAVAALLAFALPAAAQLSPGFDHFYNLEYEAALREFQKAVADDPADAAKHNHVAQTILYREMFRAGALESELVSRGNAFLRRSSVNPSPEAVKLFETHIAKSMEISNARLAKNAGDKNALYTLGVAHGLRANYNFLVRKGWMDSLRDATAARKAHNRVTELDPGFIDARLMQGVHDYVVGSLPWHWKMLGFIAGFRGDRDAGMKTLHLVAQKGAINKYDAQVLLAAIYRRERRAAEAIPLLNGLIAAFPRNYLFRLEKALMYADIGKNDQAIAVLQQLEDMKNANAAGTATLPVEKIYYYKANILFWSNQLDAALDNMRRVTPRASELDLNTGVMSWMRLGQIYDLKGNRSQAVEAYKRAVALAPNSEPGKESRGYISSPYRRG